MIRITLLVAAFGLSSCGALTGSTGSIGSIGSLGFGSRTTAQQTPTRAQLRPLVKPEQLVQDARGMTANISGAEITPTTGGAIVRATATPRGTGAYNLDLVVAGREGNQLVLDLRGQIAAAGTPVPRQVTVARSFTDAELAGIRSIKIRAANGTRTLRR